MFSTFSDSERKHVVERLRDFEFTALVTDSGLDLVQGKLVTVNDDRGLIFVVDIATGFDKTTGIPDQYLGYLMDRQFLDIIPAGQNFETLFHGPESCRVEEENLDGFLVRLQSNLSIVSKTEKHALQKQRLGQQAFRESLINQWGGKCVITGMSNLALLRASHIKPWAKCKTDAERLDVDNGLLLSANYDAAFDVGLITFTATGEIIFSLELSESDKILLSSDRCLPIRLSTKTEFYMNFHRQFVFLG